MFKSLNWFWGTVLLLLLILSIMYAFISTDAPYYLSVARDISRGLVPYKDIYNSYTPVMMYLNATLFALWQKADYHLFLSFQYIIIFSSALLIYNIARFYNNNKDISIFVSLFFFLATLSSDGTYIVLEVYVIAFVLLSFLLLQYEKYFLAGFVLAFSFFAKQYGLLNFVPFYLFLFLNPRTIRKKIILFNIGALVPLIIFLLYFVWLENIPLDNLWRQLTRNGMNTNMLYLKFSWLSFLAGAKVLILVVFPLIFLKIRPFKDKLDGILIVGALVNLIPLYIQNFGHYFILVFPYLFILMAKKISNGNKRFVVTANVILVAVSVLVFVRIIKYKDVYPQQVLVAKEKAEEFPKGSKIFLYKGYRYLYILNDYKNPVLKKVGYRYEFYPNEDFRKKFDVIAK